MGRGPAASGNCGAPAEDRSIYVMDAKTNSAFARLTKLSLSAYQGEYRLTYYQYPTGLPSFELYHLLEDPEELTTSTPMTGPSPLHLKDRTPAETE